MLLLVSGGFALNSRKQGSIGIGQAIAHFTSKGFPVCMPVSDAQRYDMVVDINNQLKRVEVKTSTQQVGDNAWIFDLRTHGGNQSWNKESKRLSTQEADILFLHCIEGDSYIIPIEEVEGRNAITVGNKYTEYKARG